MQWKLDTALEFSYDIALLLDSQEYMQEKTNCFSKIGKSHH